MNRRNFLKSTGVILGATAVSGSLRAKEEIPKGWIEARDYIRQPEGKVKCQLCPRECISKPGERGECKCRENVNGKYYSAVYSRPVTMNIDPIEKKPLFHFMPGSHAFSLATTGCNLHCKFCQNWQISQVAPEEILSTLVSPSEVAQKAMKEKCRIISYTYTEPTVSIEYVEDCAIQSRKLGIKNVTISNGYTQKKPLLRLCKTLDAIKIDLKAFSEKFYKEICSATLKPVLDSLSTIKAERCWNEIVVLLIPTLNDSPAEIRDMAKWIVKELGPDVPVHFTRFTPQYKLLNLPPTPVATLETAYDEAKQAGLHYVYLGNVPGHKNESTFCHSCGKKIITRYGFWVKEVRIQKGKCEFCGTQIPGVWA
jgi:pyruvate formate lyase activating enzyme